MAVIVTLSFVMSALSLLMSLYNRDELNYLEIQIYRFKNEISYLKSKIRYMESNQKLGDAKNENK